MSSNILGIAGRLHSGKSTISKICEKYGYKKLYFALPLKEMCSKFLNISVDKLNELKNNNEPIDVKIDDKAIDYFSFETDIPHDKVKEIIGDRTIHTVREMLQAIGTDLIRSYNMNWHINRLRKMIEPDKKYVFDDLRFPNEKQMIEDLGGDTWFVIRPDDIKSISHHISEESLKWQDFEDRVIVNNKSLEYLNMVWDNFLNNYDKSMQAREKLIVDISLEGWDKWDYCYFKQNYDEPFTMLDSLFVSYYYFTYQKKKGYEVGQIKNVEVNDKKQLIIEYKDGSSMIIGNPFNIEDVKFLIN